MLQVVYDTNTGQVLQWQDTDKYNYAPIPSNLSTLEVTQDQWNNQQGEWFVANGQLTQQMPLSIAQSRQLSIIKTAFNQAMISPYTSTVLSKPVDYNQQSLLNVQGLITYLQANPTITSIQFRCAYNNFIQLTLTQLQSLLLEMIQYGLSLHQKKWTLESEINNATTISAVQSITW